MAGTLMLLREAGWDIHYMNVANGSCGTSIGAVEEIITTRRDESRSACGLLGAHYHESVATDMQVYHNTETVAKVVSVIRRVRPRILLLHSPVDYMEDHTNACRIGVTAAFGRGMRNFPSIPPVSPIIDDVTIYHALPYGFHDPLRKLVRAGQYVDVTSMMDAKRTMLAAHASQREWLDASQGVSYLDQMANLCRQAGGMSGRFEYAEVWRRRNHLGFSATDQDPLAEALGGLCLVDADYEAWLAGS